MEKTGLVLDDIKMPRGKLGAGLHVVRITDAAYRNGGGEYRITMECTDGDNCGDTARFSYRIWDRDGGYCRNTLIILHSLGIAVWGEDFDGIPDPEGMVGEVVVADMRERTSDSGRGHAYVYRFLPATEHIYIYSDKEQAYREEENIRYLKRGIIREKIYNMGEVCEVAVQTIRDMQRHAEAEAEKETDPVERARLEGRAEAYGK